MSGIGASGGSLIEAMVAAWRRLQEHDDLAAVRLTRQVMERERRRIMECAQGTKP